MAITGYESALIRRHADGSETDVPMWEVYNHHAGVARVGATPADSAAPPAEEGKERASDGGGAMPAGGRSGVAAGVMAASGGGVSPSRTRMTAQAEREIERKAKAKRGLSMARRVVLVTRHFDVQRLIGFRDAFHALGANDRHDVGV